MREEPILGLLFSRFVWALIVHVKRRKGRKGRKGRREENEEKGSEVEAFRTSMLGKNPNSSHKCVFGWFELGLMLVLILFRFGFEIVQ